MIRQAVILAAGRGTRLRQSDGALPKPLHRVAGRSLLTRTVLTLSRAGVERVYIVCGFMADALRDAVAADPEIAAADAVLEWIDNHDYRLANGVSVLKASGRVEGAFLLSMADHVYDVALAEAAATADMAQADLYLCVDRRIDQVYDLDDATKVCVEDGLITDIGKDATEYDAVDCGVFAVGPALLSSLQQLYDRRGDCSLSDGVRVLAERCRARALDIGGAFWQDVDTPEALARAESILSRREGRERSYAG